MSSEIHTDAESGNRLILGQAPRIGAIPQLIEGDS